MDAQALQTALGYEFTSKALLQQALTHRSHSGTHNERLEFLGDSVLNCAVASLLFERYSKIDEGDLSRLRANLVKQQSLYEIAQRLELSQYLRLGEGELKSGGFRRPSILADTVEALFGAIFLDSGFDAARKAISRLYTPVLETVDPKTLGKDAKTLLQEYLQSRKIALPVYSVVATHGAAHSQEFEVECAVPKLGIQVLGSGGSRRGAEQAAAKKALEAAQVLALEARRRTRRPKQAQLSLSVAVTQSADSEVPLPAGGKGTKAVASSEKAAEKLSERAPAKPSEKDLEKSIEKSSERQSDKSGEKTVAAGSTRASEKAPEKVSDKNAPRAPDRGSEKPADKATEAAAEKSAERSTASAERDTPTPAASNRDETSKDVSETQAKLKARAA